MSVKIKELDEELIPIYSEIIEACLEYTESKVDKIYIFGINSGNIAFTNDVFFMKNNIVFDRLKIGEEIGIEITDDRQGTLINRLTALYKMYDLFMKYTGDAPREVKIKYNVKFEKFGVKLSYNHRIERSKTLGPADVFREWFAEVKSGNDGFDW